MIEGVDDEMVMDAIGGSPDLSRAEVRKVITKVADALHAGELDKTHELGVALIYLGICVVREVADSKSAECVDRHRP